MNEGRAYDILMYHNWLYRIDGIPLLTDTEYDKLEKETVRRWLWLDVVGSDVAEDYPDYIGQGRRPNVGERKERNKTLREMRVNWELDNLL